jgi:hypothetical protein
MQTREPILLNLAAKVPLPCSLCESRRAIFEYIEVEYIEYIRGTPVAENKTQPTEVSVSAFVAAITDESRRADAKTLVKLMQGATSEKPKMWGPSIIGFGSYHYVYDSGREGDAPLVGFSPRKAATVLYLGLGAGGSDALLAKLGKHTTGKGCLYIKKLADIDQKVLQDLVAKSVTTMRAKHAC